MKIFVHLNAQARYRQGPSLISLLTFITFTFVLVQSESSLIDSQCGFNMLNGPLKLRPKFVSDQRFPLLMTLLAINYY